MDQTSVHRLIFFYDEYVEFSWSKDFQLNFWKIKLDEIVRNLPKEDVQEYGNRPHFLSESIFATYDIPLGGSSGWLNVREQTKEITKQTIESDKDFFLQEIINLSIVRYHNALERLLMQAINECYIQLPQFDVYKRSCLNKVFNKMQVTREDNSMHLITYLESKNTIVKDFLKTKCNVDLNATWRELFEFFGIIRNTIVHNGMLMLWDNYKKYLEVNNDIFHYFFERPRKDKQFELKPRIDRAGLFANYSDQFATNIIKRIANKSDLKFLRFFPS
jgi:hypothetical protein